MKKKKTEQELMDYLKKEYPRCCLMENPLNIKTYNKLLQEYSPKVLHCRLRLVEMFLAHEDFLSIELTVKSIVFYLDLYANGKL